jgi:ankyrin repeat protein
MDDMDDIWEAAKDGDVDEVERLVEQQPGLLDARDDCGMTPLMNASWEGHEGVVQWLLDQGAAMNKRNVAGYSALFHASMYGRLFVVRMLVKRGADPTITNYWGSTPLMAASAAGHLEVVRFLLDHPSAKVTLTYRNIEGQTALWLACLRGCGGVVRALLESGADPTIANNIGTTPMAITKHASYPQGAIVGGRRRVCVAALEVRFVLSLCSTCCYDPLAEAWGVACLVHGAGGRACLPAVEGPADGRSAGELSSGGGGG